MMTLNIDDMCEPNFIVKALMKLEKEDADLVSFIYRPEYYGIETWDTRPETACEGQAEFNIAKHRNGPLEKIRLKFNPSLAKFTSINESIFQNEYSSKMNSDETDSENNPY